MKDNSANVLFGRRLRKLRIGKGFTPQQLSKASGINLEVLKQFEAGQLEPHLTAMAVLATALNIKLEELLDLDVNDADA